MIDPEGLMCVPWNSLDGTIEEKLAQIRRMCAEEREAAIADAWVRVESLLWGTHD